MRTAVKILSVIGFIVHVLFFVACFASSGLSDASPANGSAYLPILVPLLYFAFCFVTSLRNFSTWFLLSGGIIAHIIIVPFYYHAVRDGVGFLIIMPIVMSACWLLMCFHRTTELR